MQTLTEIWSFFSGRRFYLPATIRPTDVFLVSFPKSGNTWLRFLIANLIDPTKEWNLKNINEMIPGVYNHLNEINVMMGKRYIKSHDQAFRHYPKYIYIYRDYRDVLVSYYFFLAGSGKFKGSISDFVQSRIPSSAFGTWSDHVSKALKDNQVRPDSSLIVRYEDLELDTITQLERIATFIQEPMKIHSSEIVEKCSFQQLKSLEKKYGRVFDDIHRPFFRSGRSGDWKSHLSDKDVEIIFANSAVTEVMKNLNYLSQ